MAKTKVQVGKVLDLSIPDGKLSGDGVLVGASLFGVVLESNESGGAAIRAVAVEDCWELPKLTTDVMAVGAKVNWNDATSELQLATSTLDNVATVIEAAGNGVTTVKVKLTPV